MKSNAIFSIVNFHAIDPFVYHWSYIRFLGGGAMNIFEFSNGLVGKQELEIVPHLPIDLISLNVLLPGGV